MSRVHRDNKTTVHLGGIPAECDEDLLWELGVQFGPVASVNIPRDRRTNVREEFAFLEFKSSVDAKYCADVLQYSPLELYGKRIRVSYKGDSVAVGYGEVAMSAEIGAKICVRHMSASVDEVQLAEVFKQFGTFAAPPKVARDPDGKSKSYGFVSYTTFEASDAAIAAMNGRPLGGRLLAVDYAERMDGSGEKHGSEEERRLFREGLNGMGLTAAQEAAVKAQEAAAAAGGEVPMWARGLQPYASSR